MTNYASTTHYYYNIPQSGYLWTGSLGGKNSQPYTLKDYERSDEDTCQWFDSPKTYYSDYSTYLDLIVAYQKYFDYTLKNDGWSENVNYKNAKIFGDYSSVSDIPQVDSYFKIVGDKMKMIGFYYYLARNVDQSNNIACNLEFKAFVSDDMDLSQLTLHF